jgi:hypothetical protein
VERGSRPNSPGPFSCPYSRTSWKGNSPNFAMTEFSEVWRFFGALACFCAMAHIHFPQTRVSCLRRVTSGRHVKTQDSYLPSS